MARFVGMLGYADYVETADGVFEEQIVERKAIGDANRIARRWETSENLNDDLVASHEFSVMMDTYASQNFTNIVWGGKRWRVNDVEVRRPRLSLTVGKVYNGPTPASP